LSLGGYIKGPSIDDEGANIVAGLIHNAPIKELEINGAPNMTHVGWMAIFTALQMNPTCRLEQLFYLPTTRMKLLRSRYQMCFCATVLPSRL
jgi:hypothetical protein